MAKCSDPNCGIPFRDGAFVGQHKEGCKYATGPTYSVRTETKPVYTDAPKSNEHLEQVKVIEWCNDNKHSYPNIDRIFAIPNGGHRYKSVAGRMKAEGVKAGVPDLFLPVPMGGYHGLYIEMKYGKNKPTDNQWDWLKYLESVGYAVVVCHGEDEAANCLRSYYEGEHGLR